MFTFNQLDEHLSYFEAVNDDERRQWLEQQARFDARRNS